MVCAVSTCKNNHKTKKKNNQIILFHRFPKATNSETKITLQEWIKRCDRKKEFNPESHRICSVHFTEDDYEHDLQNELLGLPLRKKLKKTAVPSIKIPNITETKDVSPRLERLKKRKRKQEVEEIINNYKSSQHYKTIELKTAVSTVKITNEYENIELFTVEELKSEPFDINVPGPSLKSEEIMIKHVHQNIKEDYMLDEPIEVNVPGPFLKSEEIIIKHVPQNIEKEYYELKKKYETLEKNYSNVLIEQKRLTDQVKYFKSKKITSQTKRAKIALALLKTALTENQIALLSTKEEKNNWTDEELAMGFALYHFNRRCYVYLRTKLNYPLPSEKSLKIWSSKFSLTKGIIKL